MLFIYGCLRNIGVLKPIVRKEEMGKLVWMVRLEIKSIKYEDIFQCQTDRTFNLHVKNSIEQGALTGHHCVPYTLNTSSCDSEGNIVLPQLRIHRVK